MFFDQQVKSEIFNLNTDNQVIMKAFVAVACLLGVVSLGSTQFTNGRVLDPPVPALCAQRVIHERTPDGKG